jgi:plasmid stabilization system protein ParE
MIIEWREEAKASFLSCAEYIKIHSSEKIAEKWMNEVEKSLKILKTFPEAGRRIGKYRVWLPHRNYKAFYMISKKEKKIRIIKFRHAKRKPLRYG